MTTYAVKLAPTEDKRIPGFIMTFVIAALTGWIFILRPDLFENLENILKTVKAPTQIVCLIPVLASSVTAFRLKPKEANRFPDTRFDNIR
ncbi:MAG: hypothetical protein LBL72_00135 [Candidatus Accumulibacter sp.]|jgi:hypothetical protein|nr:hypothetical protein [Accumulibacter sp.]